MTTYNKFPGHGAQLMDLYDLFLKDKQSEDTVSNPKFQNFIEGIEKVILSEIGQFGKDFD